MRITPFQGDLLRSGANIIVLGIGPKRTLGPHAQALDSAMGGAIHRLLDCGEIGAQPYEVTTILAPTGINATHAVLVVGYGDESDAGSAFRALAAAFRVLSKKQRDRVFVAMDAAWDETAQQAAMAGAAVGCSGQDICRAEKKRFVPAEVQWAEATADSCEAGMIVGESLNLTRRLVNLPPQDMYPASFAAEALCVAEEVGLGIEIWDEEQLAKERCGALLAVGRGSSRAPRMVIMKYHGAANSVPPLALVGKGVTFDSGGLSIKPTDGMLHMKADMAGAATVLGAIRAIAKLQLPVNIIAVMGLVENLIGPDSYKLGDVLTARTGKTIEVHNTDAEGRLVLADALSVAVDMGAAKIIDLATLTGACVVALGTDVSGLMTNNDAWCTAVKQAAARAGEYAWELPMFDFYGQQIRSEVADIKNVGDGRWGGAITAAKLLQEFVADRPWVHMDIAGPSFLEKPSAWLDAGASGAMLRTLVEVARDFKG